MNLRPIGPSIYGTTYAFDGVVPLNVPDISDLSWGDSVRDNRGRGISMSVNVCSNCEKKYLNSTLILVPEEGPCCTWRGGG